MKDKPGSDIVLVGNPNTGKSCLFNQLTGMDAVVSNYAGTSVDIMEGKVTSKGKILRVADLPGIYSLGNASEDERVATEYLLERKHKVIINVLDATLLERNLFLTLQLLENKFPIVIALNFFNELEKKNIHLHCEKLSRILHVPVIPIDAVRGTGIPRLMQKVESVLSTNHSIKKNSTRPKHNNTEAARKRYDQAAKISKQVVHQGKPKKKFTDFLDKFTTEPLTGTIFLILIMGIIFFSLFWIGNFLSTLLGKWFELLIMQPLNPLISQIHSTFVQTVLTWSLEGVNAGLQIALPYILIFYIMMSILEDTGYLPRMAYLLDRLMHKLHLHGQATIPMMLGFGCSVPAVLATRILPNRKDRILCSILICLIPCSARTAVILGAVGKFLGIWYALLIYAIILELIFLVGFILGRYLPGDSVGLIMEMPNFRIPQIKNVLKKTWLRLKDFIYVAFPLIIIGSAVLGLSKVYGILDIVTKPFSPIISGWLMLPAIAGITLIYGILRKEMALELLFVLGGSSVLLNFMKPLQIFIFTLVVALYIPCLGTFAVLKREFGWKNSIIIAAFTIILAVIIGGLVGRLFLIFGILS